MTTTHTPPVWPGEEVPLAKVEQTLKRQYHELLEDAAEIGSRTRVATLVAVADDRAGAEDALDWVQGLRGRNPSRCIVLVTSGGGTSGVRTFARVAHQPGTRRRQRRVWDEVVVEAAVPPDHLAAVVLPLLLPEIPVFTWWLGSPPLGDGGRPDAPAFDALMDVTDRLIVDSARFRDPLADLGGLARSLPELPATSDCAWGGLTPWREALATAFDCQPLRASIDQITQVTVTVTAAAPTAGLLLIGWLASRLGWTPAAPPAGGPASGGAPQRGAGGRTLRYTAAGQPLDAELEVVTRGPTLQSVYVTARGGDTDAAAHVVPVGEHLVATVTAGGRPCAPPCVGAGAFTRTEALQAELNTFGRDRVYEQALAATLPWTAAPAGSP